ncbi:MAG: T9SS type A sorting domain-containing protein, partial [Bacteroidota bacterium]
RWEPSLSSNNNFLLNTARDTNAVYQYITQTGECPADTATLTVRLHEIDDIRQRFELVEPIFLCDENDSITVDISVKNGVYYDWNSERNETGIFSVTEPVVYHYYVTDENSCVQSGIFAGRIDSERAGVQTSETLQLCQSEPYQYQGITYTQDTLLCETFSRLSGCDSTHCLQLRFDEVSTVNKLTATICQGQVFDLFGELLTESGLYSSRKVRAGQCDSLVDLTLIVTRPNETLVDTLLPLGTVLEYNGFTFDEPGTSFLYITNPTNGCDSIIRLQLDFTTSLEELEREELQIALYPNPPTSTTQLHFQTPVRQKVEIRILDYTGRQLRTQDVQILRGATTTPVDLPDSSGIYWVQVLVEGQVGRNFRVVKR